ncbi:MAG: TolC family protein [Flavobacteriales bacterium]|nr:TolC family protein [Flavobacteriales bacterium]
MSFTRTKHITHFVVLIALAAALFTGCKAFKPIQLPELKSMPESFGTPTDTTTIGIESPKDFFQDPLLVALINEAHKNNPDVLIAVERINMAHAFLKMKRGDQIPTLDLASSGSIQKYGDYTMEGVGNFDTNLSPNINDKQRIAQPYVPNLLLGINTSWEIDIWGKFRNRKRAAKQRLMATEYGKRALGTSITSMVASLYYELLALDAELLIIRKNIELQEQALQVVLARKEAGREDQLAVERFKAQLLYTRGLEPAIKQDILLVENQLNTLLGRYPQPVIRTTDFSRYDVPVNPKVGIPSQLLLNRPDIIQAEKELAASGLEVKSARAEFLPALRINLNLGLNSFSATSLFDIPASLAFGFIGGLTGPLLNRAQIQGNFNRTAAENKISFYEYQKTLLTGYTEVYTHLNQAQMLAERDSLKREEVVVMQNAVEISENLMKTGYANYLDVITAQKSVLDAELESAVIRKNRFLNIINLYKATGGGWQ